MFILNQDAYSVEVILDGGAQTLNLPTTAGAITFNMTGYSSYQIRIRSAEPPGWSQFSTDSEDNNFYLPCGVSINKNPASPNFGKVYISESLGGATGAGRNTSSGIYVLRADSVAVGGVNTGGKDWTVGSASPWKSTIGPDGHLYVASFSEDLAYEFNDDLSVATQLIDASNKTAGQYVESILVEGTQAGGDRSIYLVDSHYLDARRGLIRYDLGANATATASDTGTQVIGPDYFDFYPRDVARDSSGNWYMNQYRSDATQAPAISKFDGSLALPINTALWETLKEAPYSGAYGIDINEAAGLVAYADYYTGYVYIFNMSDGSFVTSFDSGSRGRDVAFDAAGNLVYVDTSAEHARFWSPGGSWVTVLSSDGTFSVTPADDLPPTLVCNPSVTVGADSGLCSATVTADQIDNGSFDPAGGPLTFTLTPPSPYPVGINGVTFTATATNGLSASTNVMVIVLDSEPPTIICPPDLIVECGSSWDFGSPTAFDNCEGTNVTVRMVSTVTNVGCGGSFSAVRTWTAVDSYTNTATCSQMVVVVDSTPPTIVCPPSQTVEAQDENGARVPFVVVASDTCSPVNIVVMPAPGSLFPIGTTPVQATAMDACSNTASCSFTVTVLGAQGVKSNVLAELTALRASTPLNDSFAEKFDYVILHLENSLNPAYWIDQTHLTPDGGNIALNEEKLAANMLDVIMSSKQCPVDPAILQGFINRIVWSDRLLAMISIQDAASAGLNPNKIAEDLEQVAKGDEEAEAGRYANAIEHYRNAWRHAIQLHLQISQDGQGGTKVRFIGIDGKSYLLEVSEDLVHWVPLGTNSPDDQGNLTFTDAAPVGQAQRFYRAVEQ